MNDTMVSWREILTATLFLQLLLAHFISDYNLQTNKVFAIKMKHRWGAVFHALICGSAWTVLSWQYLHAPSMWLYLLVFAFVCHVLIDKGKIELNRVLGRDYTWLFMLDQALHFLCAAFIVYFALHDLIVPRAWPPMLALLENKLFLGSAILYLVGTYAAHIFVFIIKMNYFAVYYEKVLLPPTWVKYVGIAERSLIMLFIWLSLFSVGFLALIPLAMISGILLSWKGSKYFSMLDLLLSWGFGILCGISIKAIGWTPF